MSGCGYLDGSEITESVSAMIALSNYEAEYVVFAPSIDFHSVNHLSNEQDLIVTRNSLIESSRVSRGQAYNLDDLKENDFDALLFPGGFGAAKILSNWAHKRSQCWVLPKVEQLITNFHQSSKPIGAICIAPVLIAKTLGAYNVSITIGDDKETAQEILKTGSQHIDCPVQDFITDRLNKIITTPAYMYDSSPNLVFKGISGLIKELVEMA